MPTLNDHENCVTCKLNSEQHVITVHYPLYRYAVWSNTGRRVGYARGANAEEALANAKGFFYYMANDVSLMTNDEVQ